MRPVTSPGELAGLGAQRPHVWPRGHLSVYLVELGRRADALARVQEAITIRRELAAGWPDAYHQELEQPY